MKKKILTGLGVFFGLIVVAVAAVVIYFWPFISSVDWSIVNVSNMKALYTAFTQDEETINNKLKEIDDQRSEEIKSYLNMNIRDFTEEELERIEKGEVTKTQLIAQIIAETVAAGETVADENVAFENTNTAENNFSASVDEPEKAPEETKEEKKSFGGWIKSLFSGDDKKDERNSSDTKDNTANTPSTNNNNIVNPAGDDKNTTAPQTGYQTANGDKNEQKPQMGSDKTTSDEVKADDTNKNEQKPAGNNTQSTVKNETSDQIVAKHIAQLYTYYSQFEGKVNSLASSAKSWVKAYYTSTGCTWKEAKAAAVKHFTGTASQIETDCYAKVDAQIAALRKDLSAIGADTSIADSVAASAYSEMEAKKSQIVQQGMAKLNK